MAAKKLAFMTNERWIWCAEKPDIELLEPQSLNVTIDKNSLLFGNQMERPQQTQTIRITNNGDRSVAFKIDGIIAGRHLNGMPYARCKNFFDLVVSRRPTNCFTTNKFYQKASRKDRLFILIAPVFGCTSSAAALFNVASGYEKLRVRLVL
ncbi:hypothetical protein M3Y98_00152800 [Aphelenchoides besseyi]|nr:hypothetical protein M3Y98_00152800 [Aphelenchoides besseyi]